MGSESIRVTDSDGTGVDFKHAVSAAWSKRGRPRPKQKQVVKQAVKQAMKRAVKMVVKQEVKSLTTVFDHCI